MCELKRHAARTVHLSWSLLSGWSWGYPYHGGQEGTWDQKLAYPQPPPGEPTNKVNTLPSPSFGCGQLKKKNVQDALKCTELAIYIHKAVFVA